MKLSFFGAAYAVTGSCHCLDACGKRILIDCGLQQGRDEEDNSRLPFVPGEVDYVLVTHAHIDHSGRLPLLRKCGFRGDIITTRLTAELLAIMLRDSAHIQESDAAWKNQKGKRAGKAAEEPLYTLQDVEDTLPLISQKDYNEVFDLCDGIRVRFVDAGHLLGSAMIEIWIHENGKERKLVFSGDIGNKNQPIICDPSFIENADYVVMESTYGDRNHDTETGSYTKELAKIIDETLGKGGNVVIPSFAVGRTQELLYFIRQMKEEGLVTANPDFPVYVDSPLAEEATRIFSGDLTGYLDEEAIALVKTGIGMLSFPGLNLCKTTEESKRLNEDGIPKVIISASGMCDAGRIRHHLKHNLWRRECTVVFVGFQAVGSLGRHLLDGASSVKMFGEEIAVNASIVNFKGLSSHADMTALTEWICAFSPRPKHVFVVHGDADVIPRFVNRLQEIGISAHGPNWMEEYDLVKGITVREGVKPKEKRHVQPGMSPAYAKLLDTEKQLLSVIQKNSGLPNKDLAKFTDQLRAIIYKWER